MEGLPDPGQIWSDFTSNPVVQLAATLIVVYVVMLWLGTAYWAFRDMQARTENPILPYFASALIIFFTPLVFLFVGLTPVAQKTFNNYTLEITKPENHPRYLSTLSLSMAAPILASPLISLLINILGFQAVYLFVVGLLLLGWLLSFRLHEPRRGPRPVAPTIRMPAARTRSSTAWVYADTVSSLRTSVPSRSVAMSFGRPGRVMGTSASKAPPRRAEGKHYTGPPTSGYAVG